MEYPEPTLDVLPSSTKPPPDMSLPINVPAGKLWALLEASNGMMKNIFHDHRAMLRTVARNVHSLLEVESCGIFLVSDDRPDELVLEAGYTDKWEDKFRPLHLKIQSTLQGGLTGHIAATGEAVRF